MVFNSLFFTLQQCSQLQIQPHKTIWNHWFIKFAYIYLSSNHVDIPIVDPV